LSDEVKTARSYRSNVIGDNAVISINLKWLLQLCVLVAGLVYGYWRIESRLGQLEEKMVHADGKIGSLLSKHVEEERVEREHLEEQVAFFQKELNLNPFSWGKKKDK
tara:strand:+ start:187 stop:507 length:321 start_codon:yes stop_codon:yes gene_type:complete